MTLMRNLLTFINMTLLARNHQKWILYLDNIFDSQQKKQPTGRRKRKIPKRSFQVLNDLETHSRVYTRRRILTQFSRRMKRMFLSLRRSILVRVSKVSALQPRFHTIISEAPSPPYTRDGRHSSSDSRNTEIATCQIRSSFPGQASSILPVPFFNSRSQRNCNRNQCVYETVFHWISMCPPKPFSQQYIQAPLIYPENLPHARGYFND